jgi:folate-dependent phosphoribosylglycinamide formyltransferase PurN
MRIVLFTGSHKRHYFLHNEVIENFEVVGIVHMLREDVLPIPDYKWSKKHVELFNTHFTNRSKIEEEYFGNLDQTIFNGITRLNIDRQELNSEKTLNFIKGLEFDVAMIFGVDIIKDPVFSALPFWKINIHLGLSPWYKGAATLFWPFYFLEPQNAGATIHLIAPKADAGEIIHHSVPKLIQNQTIHEHAANVVVQASNDTIQILEKISQGKEIKLHTQRNSGKLFLEKEFRPEHLELVYTLYKDGIINKVLTGQFQSRNIELIDHTQNN